MERGPPRPSPEQALCTELLKSALRMAKDPTDQSADYRNAIRTVGGHSMVGLLLTEVIARRQLTRALAASVAPLSRVSTAMHLAIGSYQSSLLAAHHALGPAVLAWQRLTQINHWRELQHALLDWLTEFGISCTLPDLESLAAQGSPCALVEMLFLTRRLHADQFS